MIQTHRHTGTMAPSSRFTRTIGTPAAFKGCVARIRTGEPTCGQTQGFMMNGATLGKLKFLKDFSLRLQTCKPCCGRRNKGERTL